MFERLRLCIPNSGPASETPTQFGHASPASPVLANEIKLKTNAPIMKCKIDGLNGGKRMGERK
jgi:hypothetical protein